MKVITALLLLASLASASNQENRERSNYAFCEVRGPLEELVLEAGSSGTTRIVAHLRAGETRRFDVPFAGPLFASPTVAQRTPPAADIEFLELPDPREGNPARTFERRSRPPVEAAAPSVGWPAGLGLIACFVLGFAMRRRVGLCLAIGALGAAALALTPPASGPRAGAFRVLERAGDGASWFQLDAVPEGIVFEERLAALETEPHAAEIEWTVTLGQGGGAPRYEASGSGVRFYRSAALDVGPRALERSLNTWGALAETWFRSSDGVWSRRGEWDLGLPLPQAAEERTGPLPPSWLLAGLPQGREVLVARLAPGAWNGAPLPGNPLPEITWVRLVPY